MPAPEAPVDVPSETLASEPTAVPPVISVAAPVVSVAAPVVSVAVALVSSTITSLFSDPETAPVFSTLSLFAVSPDAEAFPVFSVVPCETPVSALSEANVEEALSAAAPAT